MPWRENKGVANLDGFKTDYFSCYARCFGAAKIFLVATQDVLEEILIKNGRGPEINHRNLNGIYTDFIELLRKKSLEEIFNEMLLRKK